MVATQTKVNHITKIKAAKSGISGYREARKKLIFTFSLFQYFPAYELATPAATPRIITAIQISKPRT